MQGTSQRKYPIKPDIQELSKGGEFRAVGQDSNWTGNTWTDACIWFGGAQQPAGRFLSRLRLARTPVESPDGQLISSPRLSNRQPDRISRWWCSFVEFVVADKIRGSVIFIDL